MSLTKIRVRQFIVRYYAQFEYISVSRKLSYYLVVKVRICGEAQVNE